MKPLVGYSKEQQIGKRLIPKMGKRTEIKGKEADKAIKMFGSYCRFCGNPDIELHHIIYAKQLGKGKWRNLIPLCREHHELVHRDPRKAIAFKEERIGKYGENFWCDEYDLYKMGLIENPTEKDFEKYMKGMEFPF